MQAEQQSLAFLSQTAQSPTGTWFFSVEVSARSAVQASPDFFTSSLRSVPLDGLSVFVVGVVAGSERFMKFHTELCCAASSGPFHMEILVKLSS